MLETVTKNDLTVAPFLCDVILIIFMSFLRLFFCAAYNG